MPFSQVVEALKEHLLAAIVLSLYFFFAPAYYVEKYRSWPQTDLFIIFSSIFFVFIYFLIYLIFKDRDLEVWLLPTIGKLYEKLIAKFRPLINQISLIIKPHITSFIILGSIVFGLATIYSLLMLHAAFGIKRNPFFWHFLGNYIANFIFIALIILLASETFKYVYKNIN